MKICVCIKQVPDSSISLKIDDQGLGISEVGVEYITSPYDENALEAALQLKEKHGGEVVALSMGPARVAKALREDCLARGADRAVHLLDPAFDGSDCVATAKVLAAWLKPQNFDVVLCGKQAIDDDSAAVGPTVAELLDVAHVAEVEKLEVGADGKTLTVHRAVDGGSEVIEAKAPVVLTAQKSLNTPRFASLKGRMKAKTMPIETVPLAATGVPAGAVGRDGSPTSLRKLELAPDKKVSPRILTGDAATAAAEAVRLLREQAKVI